MYAKDIWEYDKMKKDLIEKRGYELLVVWENEYNKNKKQTIEKCVKWLSL